MSLLQACILHSRLSRSYGIAVKSFPNLEQDLAFPSLATSTLLQLGIVVLLAGLSATLSSASSDAIAGVTVVRDLYKILP